MRTRFHRIRERSAYAALLLCLAALHGCDEDDPEPGPEPGGGGPAPWSLDAEFAEIEAEAPGFGGYFYEGDGTLALYVQDPATQAAAARTAVARRTGERGRSSRMPAGEADIRVRRGTYAFSQLQAWRNRLVATLLARGTVAYVDLAEDGNVLRVGALEGAEPGVQRVVAAEGIPGAAFAIVTAEAPLRLQNTLRHRARRAGVPGGYLLTWQGSDGRSGECALGFNVQLLPIRDAESYTGGYVTASHCSGVQGETDAVNHYQPDNADHLGLEVRDPAFETGGACPAGRRCRWSDAAVFAHSPGRRLEIGLLAAVSAVSSIEVTANPLSIRRKRPYPVVGEPVDKVGPGSGWTFGRVIATCVGGTTN